MTKLEQLMQDVNGNSFISITTETIVKLPGGKKNPLQGLVTKRTTGSNVMVYQNKTTNAYENMVNKRLAQEGKNPGSFTVGPRTWGTRVPNTPFVEHNGQLYLEVIFLHCGEVKYFAGETEIDPSPLDLPNHEEGEQGGLNDKVIIRTFKVESIKAITINKQHYVL